MNDNIQKQPFQKTFSCTPGHINTPPPNVAHLNEMVDVSLLLNHISLFPLSSHDFFASLMHTLWEGLRHKEKWMLFKRLGMYPLMMLYLRTFCFPRVIT